MKRLTLTYLTAIVMLPGAIALLLAGEQVSVSHIADRLPVLAFVLSTLLWFGASYAIITRFNRPIIGWATVVAGITILIFGPWWGA